MCKEFCNKPSFVISPVMYVENSLFLPISLTCSCLTSVKAKRTFVLRRGLEGKAVSIDQKDVPNLRDGLKEK